MSEPRSTSNAAESAASPPARRRRKSVTLKDVAKHVGLSPATVSLVLNRAPAADAIPKETHERVFVAAKELDYRPNHLARSLRRQRSFSVGVLVPEISEGYAAGVMAGVEGHLRDNDYFYLIGSHRLEPKRLQEYLRLLEDRAVEGYILVATELEQAPSLPTVAVANHQRLDGVTNLVIDHEHAAAAALGHLAELGHRRVAVFKGQPNSPDTEERWESILAAAENLDLEIPPELALQLSGDPAETYGGEEGYDEGYTYGRHLLEVGTEFTALFAFNDISAIGAMRAFLDAGLRIPEDISVIGFDDIQVAAFHNPSLTTIRQPLREMGETAARLLVERLTGEPPFPSVVTLETELVVRRSTGPAPEHWRIDPDEVAERMRQIEEPGVAAE